MQNQWTILASLDATFVFFVYLLFTISLDFPARILDEITRDLFQFSKEVCVSRLVLMGSKIAV